MQVREREAGRPAGGVTPEDNLCLFLCGDVMTGRGIDQILPNRVDPQLFEPYVRSAIDYVRLAERATGALPSAAAYSYPWGDALTELAQRRPHARIINLETAVTTSDANWLGKSIHYRMHPGNIPCLTQAGIDCCVLANNHTLDWGLDGLDETLRALHAAGIRTAGAGHDAAEANLPAVIAIAGGRRVVVYAYADESAGVPPAWCASGRAAGINVLADLSTQSADAIACHIVQGRRAGDVVVVSLHWGGNWGFDVSAAQRAFAHRLIDAGAADLIHGHSSHHIRGIEIYRNKPVLYGCGDFLNDYEGISGHEAYRPDLTLMYFPVVNPVSGALVRLTAVPMCIRHFRVERAPGEGASWLHATLSRESRRYGVAVERDEADGSLTLRW